MRTGTIKSQVRLQMLDQKWQQKKSELNTGKKKEEMTSEERFLEDLRQQAEKIRKENETADIYNKLKTGGILTADEIAYLKEHDPEALAQYEQAQAEKKNYENQLKNCRTKEDVERLKLNRMGNFAARAKSIVNNPYIPKSKKVELMNQLNNEVCLIRDAHTAFVKSATYQDMPTEEEMQQQRKQEAEARTGSEEEKQPVSDIEILPDAEKLPDGKKLPNAEAAPDTGVHSDNRAASEPEIIPDFQDFEGISREIRNFLRKDQEPDSRYEVHV